LVVSADQRIVGLGEFDSGMTDLGSNKKHLRNTIKDCQHEHDH
jgi:hypothetical protein